MAPGKDKKTPWHGGNKTGKKKQTKLTRIMWGDPDIKYAISWWLNQSHIDCNNVGFWKLFVQDFNTSGNKNLTVPGMQTIWLKTIDPKLEKLCKVSLDLSWSTDMDEAEQLRICSQRLQRVKELRRIKGLPVVIMEDVEEMEDCVPTNYVQPTFRPCYPNLKPKARDNVSNPIIQSSRSTEVKQIESLPITSAQARSCDIMTNAEGTELEVSTSASVQVNLTAAANDSESTDPAPAPVLSTVTVSIAQQPPSNPAGSDIVAGVNQNDSVQTSDVKKEDTVVPRRDDNSTSDHVLTQTDGAHRCIMKRKLEDIPNPLGAVSNVEGKIGRLSQEVSEPFHDDRADSVELSGGNRQKTPQLFAGATFHVLKLPGDYRDGVSAPGHESFIRMHGGTVIEADKELPEDTIVIASRNKTYNLKKFEELKQNIFDSDALYDLVMSCDLQSTTNAPKFDISHFSDYRLYRENVGESINAKLNSPHVQDKTNTETEEEKMAQVRTNNDSDCEVEKTKGKTDMNRTHEMVNVKEIGLQADQCANVEAEANVAATPGKKPSVAEEETVDLQHLPDFYNGKNKVVMGQKTKPEQDKKEALYTEYLNFDEEDDESASEKSEREDRMVKDFHMQKKMEEDEKRNRDNEKIRRGKAQWKEQKRGVTPQTRKIESLLFSLVGPDMTCQRKLASLVAEVFNASREFADIKPNTAYSVLRRLITDIEKPDYCFDELCKDFNLEPHMLDNLRAFVARTKKEKKNSDPRKVETMEAEDLSEGLGMSSTSVP